jgi:predicted DNA-binding transcriptional regulator YafY
LRTAIQERRVVRLVYHAFRRPAAESREIEPTSLVYYADHWQVAGYCRLRRGMRMFRLDRIDHFNLLPEQFTLGERHAMPERYDDWKAGSAEARVRFDPSVERWARERQPFTFVREEHDAEGPIFVYAIRQEPEFVRWLLSWGAAAEVLGPAWLRASVRHEAQSIARRHSATDTTLSGALAQAAGITLQPGGAP